MTTKDAQVEVEDNEVDEADSKVKAKKIGEEIGVEKEEAPEYEIVEEADDDTLAKNTQRESGSEKKDRRELTNKEKRALRKKKMNDKFSEKDETIRQQAERLAAMEQRLAAVDGRLHGINKAEVERAYADTQAVFRQAEADSLSAFQEGDGVKHLKALQLMSEADGRMKELRGLYAQVEKSPSTEPTDKNRTDPVLANKAKSWAAKNSWYKADGSDVDSAIAKAVAGVLVGEGFDPKTQDYWDELDDRLASRLPDRYENEDDEEEEIETPRVKKRSGPPVTGGAQRSDLKGKKTITLPTSYIEKMKREAPEIWNDPVRRGRLLAERERIIKESGQ